MREHKTGSLLEAWLLVLSLKRNSSVVWGKSQPDTGTTVFLICHIIISLLPTSSGSCKDKLTMPQDCLITATISSPKSPSRILCLMLRSISQVFLLYSILISAGQLQFIFSFLNSCNKLASLPSFLPSSKPLCPLLELHTENTIGAIPWLNTWNGSPLRSDKVYLLSLVPEVH